ncbi:SagB/ThcOx family dehydrogenase [Archangium lipolyticum]|uniref:SagB/ThcOx family dehydrogenase n=1 Tax=Archangium lipolyticum TaxID=2970465 RepID=UPI002149A563|nr:SagB/ThcOx family dehydrogenase [Archangium lipolyticum]
MTAETYIRRARTLLIAFDDGAISASNFLTNSSAAIDQLDISLLTAASVWQPPATLFALFSNWYDPRTISIQLLRLVDLGLMVVKDTPLGERDIHFERQWNWDLKTAFYHFGIKNPQYLTPQATSLWLTNRLSTTPIVPLYSTNERYKTVVQLAPPQFDSEILSVMRNRRSYRGFGDKPVTVEQLRDCLVAGVGITGFIESPLEGMGQIPLKMTPSAGGRNPYEAFVYARNVEELPRGVYHYSATENSLGLVNDSELPNLGELVGGQPWFDNAAAAIFLVANFDRTMWKYPHPTGYRVVLIESGHIAQNMLLTATLHGLASAPTSAISDSLAERTLLLNSITQSVVYTILLGPRSGQPSIVDPVRIEPNPKIA